jgi:hypothetical protein
MNDEIRQIPAATVSIDAIYEKVTALEGGVSRVEAVLKENTALQEQRLKAVEDRSERHGGRLLDHDKQLAAHALDIQLAHSDIKSIRDSDSRKDSKRAPWWNVVGAVVGIVGGAGALITILIAFSKFTEVLERLN